MMKNGIAQGRTDADGRFKIPGLAEGTYEQVTLDSTNSLVNESITKDPHPNPKESWFEEIRIDDGADCDEVEAAIADGRITRLNPFL